MKKMSLKKVVVASLLAAPFVFSSLQAEDYTLSAKDGKTRGKIKLENGKNFGYWQGTGSGAIWTVEVKKPGRATLSAMMSVPNSKLGGDLKAFLDGEEIAVVPVTKTGSWNKYKPFQIGEIDLSEGEHTITVVNDSIKGSYFANMKGLKLESESVKLDVVSAD